MAMAVKFSSSLHDSQKNKTFMGKSYDLRSHCIVSSAREQSMICVSYMVLVGGILNRNSSLFMMKVSHVKSLRCYGRCLSQCTAPRCEERQFRKIVQWVVFIFQVAYLKKLCYIPF